MPAVEQSAYFNLIGYKPHPKQLLYHNSKARFRMPCCGRRFGKSMMAGRDIQPKLFIPKKRYWCVGPTYDLGEKEFRVVWDDLIIGRGMGRMKQVKKAYNKRSGEMYIEFPWQTRIEVRSAEHPEHLVGDALDGVIMAEAAKHKHETFERYIRPALADHRGWADFPTTPEGYNWFHILWQLGLDPKFAEYESWRFPSWENPHVYPLGREDPEIMAIERTTTAEWFLQEIGADFASFVGKIYPEFDEFTHVKPHVFNPEWPNYIAFDWGYVRPLAAIEFQVDPWDRVYVWREHYKKMLRLEEHLAIMRNRENPPGYHINLTFGDAADPEAAATVSEKFSSCVAMQEAKQNWRQGIDLVKKFLKVQQTGVIDEYDTPEVQPWMTISPDCPNTIHEFNNYRVPKTNSPNDKSESNATGAAQHQDDHALDALRYGLMHVFELGATCHLSDVEDIQAIAASNEYARVEDAGYFTAGKVF